jgi:hypothetical protein
MPLGLLSGLLIGITIGLWQELSKGIEGLLIFGIIFGMTLGLPFGFIFRIAFGLAFGLAFRIVFGLVGGLSIGLVASLGFGLLRGWNFGFSNGIDSFLTFVMGVVIAILRPDNLWIAVGNIPRVTPLILLAQQLDTWLENDWERGVINANQLLRYSFQNISVDTAINNVLDNTPSDKLFNRIAKLSDFIEDWDILRYTSSSLLAALKLKFITRSIWLPYKSWIANRWRATDNLRFDKPYRAASAGFFHLYQASEFITMKYELSTPLKMRHFFEEKRDQCNLSLSKAINSLEQLRTIKHGEEIYQLAYTLRELNNAISIEDIVQLKPICFPEFPELRPTTWAILKKIELVVKDIRVLGKAISRTARSYALNRALGQTTEILDELKLLPAHVSRIERPILYAITNIWYILLFLHARKFGQIEIDKPIINPYIIGDPVLANRFIGREDILRQMQELWIVNKSPQSAILYGHRRMGKTSILRNVAMNLGAQVRVAYVNLLSIGSAPNGITDILMAICDALQEVTDIPAPNNNDLFQFPETTFRRHLQHIEKNFTGTGLIIALDEFEKIEELIDAGKLSKDFLGFLRGMVQMSSKLAFAFAGLHTLQEMNADYFQPFYASFIPISVAFLTRDATHQVLANPDPEFLLEYETAALDHIYNLTNGQPYLTQLIGFQLVRMFNDYVFEQGKPRDRTFTIDDVHTICSGENFFTTGINYFNGVWQQAAEGATHQQDILKALAPHPQGLTESELISQTNLPSNSLKAALKTLKDHDVIRSQKTNEMVNWAIAVELFRTWVVKYKLM